MPTISKGKKTWRGADRDAYVAVQTNNTSTNSPTLLVRAYLLAKYAVSYLV